jgi:hypothetical protein
MSYTRTGSGARCRARLGRMTLALAHPQQCRLGTLVVSAKINDIDPQAWLAYVLANLAQHPASRLDELLPWHGRPQNTVTRHAA